ncbi:MAG: type III-A CRISPR-associated protein Csm2 [Deltaproteobacteria bacterium]|nr:type III-A CRISPR-associated protein Csm2 [Deltaproteobacteria bacterium]MBW2020963.1 type III-A CRISPR-associated protein Csm2 [Deltaproteobacteria bacterium]MBW2098671.1 type III-A CRISPR-associated protein Csm2 [Deltaproteobacteria bacterium]
MLKPGHKYEDTPALVKEQVEHWIQNGPSNELVTQTDKFGEYIARQLKKTDQRKKTGNNNEDIYRDEIVTTSQIRQIFGKLKSIEAKGFDSPEQRTEFMMLKPLIAYAAGRHDKTGLDRLKERVCWGIDAVLEGPPEQEPRRFKNFCRLFEAILAYHKAHGGS